jgi:hypothetical protein
MRKTNTDASLFAILPLEIRQEIYKTSDKVSLSRLAQTCRTFSEKINPEMNTFGRKENLHGISYDCETFQTCMCVKI